MSDIVGKLKFFMPIHVIFRFSLSFYCFCMAIIHDPINMPNTTPIVTTPHCTEGCVWNVHKRNIVSGFQRCLAPPCPFPCSCERKSDNSPLHPIVQTQPHFFVHATPFPFLCMPTVLSHHMDRCTDQDGKENINVHKHGVYEKMYLRKTILHTVMYHFRSAPQMPHLLASEQLR